MNLVHNERVKLTAGALNTIAVALVVTGLIVPLANAVYAGTLPQVGRFWWLIGLTWSVGGLALRSAARRFLGELRS